MELVQAREVLREPAALGTGRRSGRVHVGWADGGVNLEPLRRAKIVATLGPSTRSPEAVRGIIEAGADVVRLNLAHDVAARHERSAALARREALALDRVIGVLVDLPGPKMRTGALKKRSVTLEAGGSFTLTTATEPGDASHVGTSVEGLSEMVFPGDVIYLADGEIVLEVGSVARDGVRTRVVRGGTLRSRKGMHVPGAERSIQTFSPADRDALEVGLKLEADLVGISFVRGADDVRRVRQAMPAEGPHPLVVAKIETRAAVDNIDDIVAEADAVMVARGDLGIQTSLEAVPLLQKKIISACNREGKAVITATQMLESMTRSPLPTRAEVADVANAVLDGTDALMLSEETAVGEHATDAVVTMGDIVASAESAPRKAEEPAPGGRRDDGVSWAVAHAAVQAAEDVCVAAILCPTRTGATPRRVAAFRPSMPIVGLAGVERTLGALSLAWGVIPLAVTTVTEARDTSEEVARAAAAARAAGLIRRGDLVAVVAGSPGPRAGSTDYVRIARA